MGEIASSRNSRACLDYATKSRPSNFTNRQYQHQLQSIDDDLLPIRFRRYYGYYLRRILTWSNQSSRLDGIRAAVDHAELYCRRFQVCFVFPNILRCNMLKVTAVSGEEVSYLKWGSSIILVDM